MRGLELRGTARLFTEGLHDLRARIWQHYQGTAPTGSVASEIGVRIEGAHRAWDLAD